MGQAISLLFFLIFTITFHIRAPPSRHGTRRIRLRMLNDLPSLQGSKAYNHYRVFPFPGTCAPNHYSRLPSSLVRKILRQGESSRERCKKRLLDFGIHLTV